jgi:hypothetical protein
MIMLNCGFVLHECKCVLHVTECYEHACKHCCSYCCEFPHGNAHLNFCDTYQKKNSPKQHLHALHRPWHLFHWEHCVWNCKPRHSPCLVPWMLIPRTVQHARCLRSLLGAAIHTSTHGYAQLFFLHGSIWVLHVTEYN